MKLAGHVLVCRCIGFIFTLTLACATWLNAAAAPAQPLSIICPKDPSRLERLAAREICRYVYLRTGEMPTIAASDEIPQRSGGGFVVARKDRALLRDFARGSSIPLLRPQEYVLRTVRPGGSRFLLIAGGDEVAVLYGAYRLAEHIGVGFYLHGDAIPDQRIRLEVPTLSEQRRPLFDIRGIQPFHDFPEGPDWWNLDDYKVYISQLPKMGMNFIGLHTYPEGGVGPEPAVWIGPAGNFDEKGNVTSSYSSTWSNTLRGTWGYAPKPTGQYAFGASQLFEQDGFGPELMFGHCPRPTTPQANNEVFNSAAAQLRGAFEHAHSLGVKTCVGTETPLTVPAAVRAQGALSTQAYYEGVFQRIMRAYPIDYYWFWTPEDWTWSGTTQQRVHATVDDINAAIEAKRKVNAPFTLATCGWVLGPPTDRALFDTILPKDMPMSCINRQVGKEAVEVGFANVHGRPKWAIPWMEDDPNLLQPQLWAGRMRKDAADALKYGCTGLLGIHWRTRILSPNVSALAQAAWDQEGWNKSQTQPAVPEAPRQEGPVGGNHAAFPNNRIAETDQQPVYQTVRYDVSAYNLSVPKGRYTVTLRFCEPHYTAAEKRVFGVKLQGKDVIDRLDIFARVGQNRPLDYTFKDIDVSGGRLEIEFLRIVEFPSIAGIVIEGPNYTRKINCGGAAYKEYAADWPPSASGISLKDRYLPTEDFYLDFAKRNFGTEAAAKIAAIFAKIDGHLPEPSGWIDGPGGLTPNPGPWQNAARLYAFVDEFAALRPQVQGPANLERFDYWLNNFRHMKATEKVKFFWAQYNEAMKKVAAEKDPAAKARLAEASALPIRKQLVAAVSEAYGFLLATVSTPGEMGTVCNWEQHVIPALLTRSGAELAKALGKPLPEDAQPTARYSGPTRIILPTQRPSIAAGEALRLKVLILSESAVREVSLNWRPLGRGQFTAVPLKHIARGVYGAEIPSQPADITAIEYYVKAATDDGRATQYPPSAPAINQTVVIE